MKRRRRTARFRESAKPRSRSPVLWTSPSSAHRDDEAPTKPMSWRPAKLQQKISARRVHMDQSWGLKADMEIKRNHGRRPMVLLYLLCSSLFRIGPARLSIARALAPAPNVSATGGLKAPLLACRNSARNSVPAESSNGKPRDATRGTPPPQPSSDSALWTVVRQMSDIAVTVAPQVALRRSPRIKTHRQLCGKPMSTEYLCSRACRCQGHDCLRDTYSSSLPARYELQLCN